MKKYTEKELLDNGFTNFTYNEYVFSKVFEKNIRVSIIYPIKRYKTLKINIYKSKDEQYWINCNKELSDKVLKSNNIEQVLNYIINSNHNLEELSKSSYNKVFVLNKKESKQLLNNMIIGLNPAKTILERIKNGA